MLVIVCLDCLSVYIPDFTHNTLHSLEHINRRFKIFKILAERYRNRRRRYGLRCNLIAALYNYELNQVAAQI